MPAARLILASRSPQRALLLREAGFDFERIDPPFADPPHPQDTAAHPERTTLELARRKAASLAAALPPGLIGRVILAADTVGVGADGRLIGQAADPEHARQMLLSFVGRTHRVVTGVALRAAGESHASAFADTAVVTWGPIDGGAIERYLDGGAWRGKAGAYNLVDRLDAGWPIGVEGDPATVVGLPMRRLVPLLRSLGIEPAAEAIARGSSH